MQEQVSNKYVHKVQTLCTNTRYLTKTKCLTSCKRKSRIKISQDATKSPTHVSQDAKSPAKKCLTTCKRLQLVSHKTQQSVQQMPHKMQSFQIYVSQDAKSPAKKCLTRCKSLQLMSQDAKKSPTNVSQDAVSNECLTTNVSHDAKVATNVSHDAKVSN